MTISVSSKSYCSSTTARPHRHLRGSSESSQCSEKLDSSALLRRKVEPDVPRLLLRVRPTPIKHPCAILMSATCPLSRLLYPSSKQEGSSGLHPVKSTQSHPRWKRPRNVFPPHFGTYLARKLCSELYYHNRRLFKLCSALRKLYTETSLSVQSWKYTFPLGWQRRATAN